jgi:VanZ family protein
VSSFLRYWLPVLLWASVIFGMSTGVGSSSHTSRILRPLLRWLNPDVTDETIERIQFCIRKAGHCTEYAILAALLWRARRKPSRDDTGPLRAPQGRPGRRGDAAFAVLVAVLFAITDEWHQSFVPSRDGNPRDVVIDGFGALAGVLAISIKRKPKPISELMNH